MAEKGWQCHKCKAIYRKRDRAELCLRYHLNELPGKYIPVYIREFRVFAESIGMDADSCDQYIATFGGTEVDMVCGIKYAAVGATAQQALDALEDGIDPDSWEAV